MPFSVQADLLSGDAQYLIISHPEFMEGRYRVVVKEDDLIANSLVPTYDPTGSEMNNQASLKLRCNQKTTKIDFGYTWGL